MDLSLSKELATRRDKLWDIVEDNGCHAALVYGNQEHSANFRYLADFVPTMGDMWGVLSGKEKMECVLTFHWEIEEARQRSGIDGWYGEFDPLPMVIELLRSHPHERIAVAGRDRLPISSYERLQANLTRSVFIDIGAQFSALRRIKSAFEISLLREAAAITDAAMDAIRTKIQPGVSEHALAAELLYYFQSHGISRLAFSPLVVSGNENPVIARDPTDRHLQVGDTVMIDIGAEYQGYQADVTRTFVLGEANPIQQRAWDTVLKAYQAVLDITRPGTPCSSLHSTAQEILAGAEYPMLHRIGHGIGLATSFEWPSLDTESSPLAPGMTIAIEPAVYARGAGSMKLEDSLLVTEVGCEVLSNCSRALIIPI